MRYLRFGELLVRSFGVGRRNPRESLLDPAALFFWLTSSRKARGRPGCNAAGRASNGPPFTLSRRSTAFARPSSTKPASVTPGVQYTMFFARSTIVSDRMTATCFLPRCSFGDMQVILVLLRPIVKSDPLTAACPHPATQRSWITSPLCGPTCLRAMRSESPSIGSYTSRYRFACFSATAARPDCGATALSASPVRYAAVAAGALCWATSRARSHGL